MSKPRKHLMLLVGSFLLLLLLAAPETSRAQETTVGVLGGMGGARAEGATGVAAVASLAIGGHRWRFAAGAEAFLPEFGGPAPSLRTAEARNRCIDPPEGWQLDPDGSTPRCERSDRLWSGVLDLTAPLGEGPNGLALGLGYRFGATAGPFVLTELRLFEPEKQSGWIVRSSAGLERFQLVLGRLLG